MSQYKFVETNEDQTGIPLPSEAMTFDGLTIESAIDGYRTLSVSGRELLETELSTVRKGYVDGEEYLGSRKPSRTITVHYQLVAKNSQDFREKYNQLNRVLDKNQVPFFFADEPDKYFIGSKSDVGEVPHGVNQIVSSFEIVCSNPFKHAAVEKQFTNATNKNVLKIINNGTVPVPIDYLVHHNHENGYVGFTSEHGVAQIGNAAELDNQVVSKSVWVIKDDTSAELNNNWATGQGYLTESGFGRSGTWAGQTIDKRQYLVPSGYGPNINTWHFATKYRKFSADTNGKVGSNNFTATTRLWFANGLVNSAGIMSFILANSTGTKKIGFIVHKYSRTNNLCRVKLYYNGDSTAKEDYSFEFNLGQNNITSFATGIFSIKKIREKITFTFGGKDYSFVVKSLENIVFDNVTIASGVHGVTAPVTRMNWDYVFVQVHSVDVETDNDIPNSFAEGSEILIDKGHKYYYLPTSESSSQAIPKPDVKGSKWFLAPPGETEIQLSFSDFSTPLPDVVATIREEYL